MTLKQLEAFYWACTLGSFQIAAKRLHVTQSSLSKRIQELESDLGKSLFDRTKKRAVMTAAGELLLDHARRMLDLEEEIRKRLGSVGDEVSGTVRIGISELSAASWFPGFAQRLYERFPLLTLEPQVGLGRALEQKVTRGELDLAIIAGPSTHESIASQPVADVDYSWMASPSLFPQGCVMTAEQIENSVVITGQPESAATHVFNDWVAVHGIRLRRVLSCNSSTAITALTVAACGVSFLPVRHVGPLVERGLLVPVRSDPPAPTSIEFICIWRRDDQRSSISLLKEILRQEVDFSVRNPLWTTQP